MVCYVVFHINERIIEKMYRTNLKTNRVSIIFLMGNIVREIFCGVLCIANVFYGDVLNNLVVMVFCNVWPLPLLIILFK